MNLYLIRVRTLSAAILIAVLLFLPSAWAQTNTNVNLSKVHIGNFGRLNDVYYRGSQPAISDYSDLAALGVKTVIDLTFEGRADEPGLVKKAGMNFYRIPLKTTERPSEAAIVQFLQLVNDPANQPVYVHCQGGRHRTGVMTAVYRMTNDGWTAEHAYQEMKQYHFEGFPGHPQLKSFVFDYYLHLKQPLQADKLKTVKAAGIPE